MEPNEKPATYPPAMHEKQRIGNENEGRRHERSDLEGGDANQDEDEDQMDELEGGLGEHAFHHPALYKPQVSYIDGLVRLIVIVDADLNVCSLQFGYLAIS